MGNGHRERREQHVNLLPVLINPMEASVGHGVATGDVIAVIGKLFARRKTGSFANNLITFDHELAAICVRDHPLASEQGDRAFRTVFDSDEINERVWLVRRE